MGIKDTFVSLYIKKFVMPHSLVIDKPGFVNFNLSGKTSMFARQVIMPESFLVGLESRLISKFGDKGKQMLYSLGKKFGYRFALIGNFIKRGDVPESELAEFVGIVSKFVEGTYASEISGDFDVPNSSIRYRLKNFIVISKLGYGYFLPVGGTAGLVARLFNDSSIEVINSSKDGEYDILECAPLEKLKQKFSNLLVEDDLSGLEVEPEYAPVNQVQEISSATSFKQLLDSGYFSYADGIIKHGDQRYFLLEISGWYLLEKELSKNAEAMNVLCECAIETGRDLPTTGSTAEICQILTATGWGNPMILSSSGKASVVMTHVPWTKYYLEVKFSILNGFLSGMLSRVYGREVRLKDPVVDFSTGQLSLQFDEA